MNNGLNPMTLEKDIPRVGQSEHQGINTVLVMWTFYLPNTNFSKGT